MPTRLAFWPVPLDEDVTLVSVMRSSSEFGDYDEVITLRARDGYDNWVTHFEDKNGLTGDSWYRAQFWRPIDATETSFEIVEVSQPVAAAIPYAVTPQMVLDTIQGIDFSRVEAGAIQRILSWMVDDMEYEIRMNLSPTPIVGEIHDPDVFDKILGGKVG